MVKNKKVHVLLKSRSESHCQSVKLFQSANTIRPTWRTPSVKKGSIFNSILWFNLFTVSMVYFNITCFYKLKRKNWKACGLVWVCTGKEVFGNICGYLCNPSPSLVDELCVAVSLAEAKQQNWQARWQVVILFVCHWALYEYLSTMSTLTMQIALLFWVCYVLWVGSCWHCHVVAENWELLREQCSTGMESSQQQQ